MYKTTVINSSKETLAYSDFPIPKEYPNFMHHTKVMEYYNLYADRFNLRKYIRLNMEVISCEPADDFKQSAKWKLTVENMKTHERETLSFDGVLICIGHHAEPYLPLKDFPDIERFRGTYTHSRTYRDSTPYTDKSVVIVGSGNSACDIAVELSRNAKQTFLSTRRGAWVFNRISDNGAPFDLLIITRLQAWLMNNIPSIVNPMFESVLNSRFDHAKYGLKPKHRVLSQHPTINDELPNRIVNGTVKVKGNIAGFTETDVIFKDGTREKADVVIFATGFSFGFPFVDKKVIDNTNHESNLYRLMWPMNLEHNTLAVIGLVQPLGVIAPSSELQARWATRVIKGINKLPSNAEMKEDYEHMMDVMRKRYLQSHRHTIEVDGVNYMDSVAEMIPCKPNRLKLFLTDPLLAWKVYVGPFTCVQYRLNGPGKWKDARKTIMTQWDRVWYPMQREQTMDDGCHSSMLWMSIIMIAIAFVLLRFFQFF